jgi:hypothetical protein
VPAAAGRTGSGQPGLTLGRSRPEIAEHRWINSGAWDRHPSRSPRGWGLSIEEPGDGMNATGRSSEEKAGWQVRARASSRSRAVHLGRCIRRNRVPAGTRIRDEVYHTQATPQVQIHADRAGNSGASGPAGGKTAVPQRPPVKRPGGPLAVRDVSLAMGCPMELDEETRSDISNICSWQPSGLQIDVRIGRGPIIAAGGGTPPPARLDRCV